MGPASGILLRRSLAEEEVTDLERWLRSVSSSLEGTRGDWWPFWIKEGDRIGLADDCSEACAFGLHLEKARTEGDFLRPDGSTDEDIRAELYMKREQLFCYLGYVPAQTIQLYAGCKGRIDHRILGQLTLLLARRYDAMIDLQGALYPPLKRGRNILDVTVAEVEQYIRELSLPGEICHVYYTTTRYTPWLYHLIDADFLSAWLQHPRFYMIK